LIAGLIARILDNTISGKIAKDVFDAMWQGEGTADQIIEKKGLKLHRDSDSRKEKSAKHASSSSSVIKSCWL